MLEKGHHYVDIALDEVVFFIRPEHLVPVSKGGSCVEKVDFEHLGLLGFVEREGSCELYDDDGYSRDYDSPSHYTQITVDAEGRISSSGEGGRKVFRLI